jgi:hypothetical protein
LAFTRWGLAPGEVSILIPNHHISRTPPKARHSIRIMTWAWKPPARLTWHGPVITEAFRALPKCRYI